MELERIHHPYDVWEDYPAGFYENVSGKEREEMISKVLEMFNSEELTKDFMFRVIKDWPKSCEHNLTNMALNRIAYIGQAACCIYASVPSTVTMEAWSLLSKETQAEADRMATAVLMSWTQKQISHA